MFKQALVLILVTAVITYFITTTFLEKRIVVKLPDSSFKSGIHNYGVGDSFSCESLINTFVQKEPFENKISGELTQGTTRLSLTINKDSLELITTAAVEIGITNSATFPIMINDENEIYAVGKGNGLANQANVFVLSKETGLLLWTKTSSLHGAYAFSEYLNCK